VSKIFTTITIIVISLIAVVMSLCKRSEEGTMKPLPRKRQAHRLLFVLSLPVPLAPPKSAAAAVKHCDATAMAAATKCGLPASRHHTILESRAKQKAKSLSGLRRVETAQIFNDRMFFVKNGPLKGRSTVTTKQYVGRRFRHESTGWAVVGRTWFVIEGWLGPGPRICKCRHAHSKQHCAEGSLG
jgi:hypothetical protein